MFNRLNKLARRGQVVILFAFFLPLVLIVTGVGIDITWYFLNVSRLQNAADAAALAGARTLVNQNADNFFSVYKPPVLANKISTNTFSNKNINTYIGDQVALEYIKKNLETNSSMIDSWTKSQVEFNKELYAEENDKQLYYVVQLTEEINHLFLSKFQAMKASTAAIAKLTMRS